jgi:hypothetical protein
MSKLFSRTLAAFALTGSLVASFAIAGTSDSVTLGGSVSSSLSINATDTSEASSLNLSGGLKIVKVADIVIGTNNEQGFTLSASSGDLTKAGGTSISFQVMTVDDGASAPASGDFTVDSGDANEDFGSSGAGEKEGDLYIKYSPATLQDPGNYSGSISLTVSDN